MPFGLSPSTIDQLQNVFKKHPEIEQVNIYGSRATGDYRKGSDIDLVLFSNAKNDLSSLMLAELDDLPTPYLFDVISYHNLSKGYLKTEVDKNGKIFYKKESPSAISSVVPASSAVPAQKGIQSKK